jgi:quercetin dioxygenase-like cupin family protein
MRSAVVAGVAVAACFAAGQAGGTKDRAQILLSTSLPKLNGDNLKAFLVEVRYGPGESSKPHTHGCAVIGYIVAGSLRTQVKGEPERIYKAGESFYEAPNGVHLVSANASDTQPAKFVAYMLCDRDTPLSVDVSESGTR